MASVREIASRAEVSVGSVSRYINGYKIKKDTKDKIEHAIEQVEGRTFRQLNIGLVMPVLNDSYSGALASEMQKCISKTKHRLIVICSTKLEDDIEYILNNNLDGIILHPPSRGHEEAIAELSRRLTVVLVDMIDPSIKCDQVSVDNVNAIYNAVERLIQENHTRVALAVNDTMMLMGNERKEGYRRVLYDYGIPWREELLVKVSEEADVIRFLESRKENEDAPTAIVSTNLDITVICAKVFLDKGINIPQDLQFVAFDDFGFSRFTTLNLCYVVQPMHEIAKNAVELLLKRILGDMSSFPQVRRIKANFIDPKEIRDTESNEKK